MITESIFVTFVPWTSHYIIFKVLFTQTGINIYRTNWNVILRCPVYNYYIFKYLLASTSTLRCEFVLNSRFSKDEGKYSTHLQLTLLVQRRRGKKIKNTQFDFEINKFQFVFTLRYIFHWKRTCLEFSARVKLLAWKSSCTFRFFFFFV